MDPEKPTLSIADYSLFILMLLLSGSIGLYFRFTGGKQKTMKEFVLAGKNMPILPVAFSIMASYLSAITILGAPAEVYLFGLQLFYSLFSYPIGVVVASYVCLPVFFKVGACTAYEYLEKRFGKLARTCASVIFLFQTVLYMSVVLYAPSLALSAVTGLSTWTSVISIGVVCTFYCSLGGMKAVLWTDLFQALLMFTGIFAVLIKGFLDIGFSEVFKIGYGGGRIFLPKLKLDFTERYTVYNIFLQGCILPLISFGSNQVQVQRLLTLKTISRCRMTLYVGILLYISFSVLTYVVGLVIYAHFHKCDPLKSPLKPISGADQLLPYYIMTVLGLFPGLPGLCICGVFGAALSTVSSAMNSLSAVTMQDLVKPFLESRKFSEKTMAFSAKLLTIFYGGVCILLTVLAASFGTLMQAAIIVYGMCGVPVLVVFLLGMLTTRANEKGVLIGLLSSLCTTAWIAFGTAANGRRPKTLPLSSENCPTNSSLSQAISSSILNATMISISPETSAVPQINAIISNVSPLYRISYLWYGPFGLLIGLSVGYISSIIINHITGNYPDVSEDFLSPIVLRFSRRKEDLKEKALKIPLQEASEHLPKRSNDS